MAERLTEAELIEPARRALAVGVAPADKMGKASPHRWKRGESGNPQGVGRFYARARKLFQEHAEALGDDLIELALNAQDERVKAMCLIACLDRAGIRPTDYDPSQDNPANSLDVSKLSAEQREQLRGLIAAMRAAETKTSD